MESFITPIRQFHKELAVGLDISDTYSQISIGFVDADSIETLSTVPGAGNYLIPTALFKRNEVNQWFSGNEAVSNKDGDGYYIDNLLSVACKGESVIVGTEAFAPTALLALFIKRTLAMINPIAPVSSIASLMITVDVLNHNSVAVLSKAVESLGLKCPRITIQSHAESFYYYTIYQEKELWKHDTLCLYADGDRIKAYRLECNSKTTPIVSFVDTKEFVLPNMTQFIGEGNAEQLKRIDQKFSEEVQKSMEGRIFSSIYMIGDAFKGEWCYETQKYLCQKARVFQGNNLFSKGAAYGAKNKLKSTVVSEGHVFLDSDKLKSNIGMNVNRRGENGYLAFLDAGINWYEASSQCDIILDNENKISLVITPMTGKDPRVVDIMLEDLPKRPPKASRIHIEMNMKSETELVVKVSDCGFGDLYASSNLEWNEVISV